MRWTLLAVALAIGFRSTPFGFFAHRGINFTAIFSLPPEMFGFYKQHAHLITEWATKPDQRRYIVKGEDVKHYIDLDRYERCVPLDTLPFAYDSAVKAYTKDTLHRHGILPWNLIWQKNALTQAFVQQDFPSILRLSADLGHYIADAHVPLHTTRNYNGQLTNQHGIHGFWESRLPELFWGDYNVLCPPAQYIYSVADYFWTIVSSSYSAKDSVLALERKINPTLPVYTYETRGRSTVRAYSVPYATAYHKALNHMVERRIRGAIQATANIWFTCWVDAGQPSLEQHDSMGISTSAPDTLGKRIKVRSRLH